MPYQFTRADGSVVHGTRGVGLCPVCDRDDPDTQGVLAFFAVHESVTDETVASAAELLAEWAERVARRTREAGDLQREIDAEHRRWLDGDL